MAIGEGRVHDVHLQELGVPPQPGVPAPGVREHAGAEVDADDVVARRVEGEIASRSGAGIQNQAGRALEDLAPQPALPQDLVRSVDQIVNRGDPLVFPIVDGLPALPQGLRPGRRGGAGDGLPNVRVADAVDGAAISAHVHTHPRSVSPPCFETRGRHASSGIASILPGCRPIRSRPGSYAANVTRSEEHTSELQSLMRISYAVFCLKKKKKEA